MHAYIYIYTQIETHNCIYVFINAYTSIYTHIYIYIHNNTYKYIQTYTHLNAHPYKHLGGKSLWSIAICFARKKSIRSQILAVYFFNFLKNKGKEKIILFKFL